MPSKRFLGLGFTFAAQDKGLEKKLKNINQLFGEINRTVNLINRKSGKMSGMAEEMHKAGSAFGGMGRGGGGGGARATGGPSPKTFGRKTPGTYEDEAAKSQRGIDEGSAKKLQDMAKAYAEALEGYGPVYAKESERIIEKAIAKGRRYNDVAKDLSHNAERMAESATLLGNKFKYLKMTFIYIKEWSKDIMHSLGNFLDTIGVNLRDMIPREFTATLGVLKSLSQPLVDFGKSIMRSVLGKGDKATQLRLAKNVKDVGSAIGDNKSLPTVQKLLSMILGVSGGDDKKKDAGLGIFDRFKAMLAGIPLIGPLLGALAGTIGKAIGGFSTLTGWLWKFVGWAASGAGYVFKAIRMVGSGLLELPNLIRTAFAWVRGFSLGEVLAGVGEVFQGLMRVAGNLWRIFAELVVPIVALSGALYGFVQEIWNYKDTIIETFSVIGKLGAAVMNYAIAWLQPVFEPMVNLVSSVITPAFDMLGKALHAIFDIFKFFGSSIGKMVGMSFEIFNNYAKSATTNLNTATKELARPVPQTSQVNPSQVVANAGQARVGIDAMRATSDMANNQLNGNILLQKQIDIQSKTNDLIGDLLDKSGGQRPIPLSIQVSSDSKMIRAKVLNGDVEAAHLSGTSQ